MNRGRLILGIGLIAIAAAIFAVSSSANLGIGYEGGNDYGITTSNDVTSIHAIKTEGIVDMHINTSDTEKVRYVFNDKLYKNKSTFKDGVLQIKFSSKQKGFNLFGYSSSDIDVFVSAKSLRHIEMNGVGSVKNEGILETNEIKIINEGTGSINLKVDAQKVKGRNAGVGSMTITGSADTVTLSNQGVGSLNADKLVAQVVDAKNDGVGSMEVYAETQIKLRNAGVGSLRYSGDAQVISSHSEGIGSISKR